MKQWHLFGVSLEVPTLPPKEEIAAEKEGGDKTLGKILQLEWHHQPDGNRNTGQHYQKKRRENSSGPAFIEALERELATFKVSQDDAGNEKTGDDKEHINANVPAGRDWITRVKQDHRNDRQCSEAVNFWAVSGGVFSHCCLSVPSAAASDAWTLTIPLACIPSDPLLKPMIDLQSGADTRNVWIPRNESTR